MEGHGLTFAQLLVLENQIDE
ncbi:MAG TPA: DNA polymerase subunit beta, partial [Pseudomonas sp.]|nr:DNA polymerase subunit beta [Pseudomonas sp.]